MPQVREPEADELSEMANLFPRTTGLPMTVWVSPRGHAQNIANTAVVGVRPTPHVIAGHLFPDDERVVFEWISLNAAAIVEYRGGRIDTIGAGPVAQAASVVRPSGRSS